MSASKEFKSVPISTITIGNRQRKTFKGVDSLADSIKRIGLLHPIIITRDNKLVAGECRIKAFIELGYTEIPVQYYENLSEEEIKGIEIEENIKRQNMHWKEEAEAVLSYHEMLCRKDEDWTPEKTSDAIGISRPVLVRYNIVAQAIRKGNKNVGSAENIGSAYNQAQREIQRATDEEIANVTNIDIIDDSDEDDTDNTDKLISKSSIRSPDLDIVKQDFLKWAPTYKGRKFNFIHCDFPYGINYQKSDQGGGSRRGTYDDSPDIYWNLLKCFCDNIDKFMMPSAHVMFWYSMTYHIPTVQFLEKHAPSLVINPRPLVWHKSDNSGILPDPERGPRFTYEVALHMIRGDRRIVKSVAASYSAPTTSAVSQHLTQKPEPVLKHYFRMYIDELTEMLDPTCGSATSIIAADASGAKRVYGMDINQDYIDHARLELARSRQLAEIAKSTEV